MSEEGVEVIKSRLSVLLHAVNGAYPRKEVAKLRGASEMDRRHDWDALLLKLYLLGPKSRRGDGKDILLEQTLNFPRNLALDFKSIWEVGRALKINNHVQWKCSHTNTCGHRYFVKELPSSKHEASRENQRMHDGAETTHLHLGAGSLAEHGDFLELRGAIGAIGIDRSLISLTAGWTSHLEASKTWIVRLSSDIGTLRPAPNLSQPQALIAASETLRLSVGCGKIQRQREDYRISLPTLAMGVGLSLLAVTPEIVGPALAIGACLGAAAVVPKVVRLFSGLRSSAASGTVRPNPVMEELQRQIREERERADDAEARRERSEADRREDNARMQAVERERAVIAEELRWADSERTRADRARRDAEAQVRSAEQEKTVLEESRRRAEEERRRVMEERDAAHEERQRANNEVKMAEEEWRKAEEARWKSEEEAQKAEERRLRAEEDQRIADEEVRLIRLEMDRKEHAKVVAERTAAEARAALQKAEKSLKEGIRPVVIPTTEEFEATKKKLRYRDGVFHFAIAGVSGSGKSSLINAFRGIKNNSKDALKAPVGIVETTKTIARYADPDSEVPFFWYDVPGAGTLDVPDWIYFNDQGLYVFDCILVLIDNRFMATDLAILRNCARFKIPAYIVRSKSKQHISNLAEDLELDDEDEGPRLLMARQMYISETRKNVAQNLEAAGLMQQKVYMVDRDTLVKVRNGEQPREYLDEWNLLHDILTEASIRREGRKEHAP
ncbi:uncharacterized protein FIBRA_07348 [Fibroporia radiculosa]|uniref:IRG-type G domain-containing protein n=1 Tax=Fibroporia radiculosa TaxID=599839 RepID=J4GUR9_9APHY|nr:uncharacterized protein FIBRA_07348 [Fibroporia radiculosa]CCM05140.1 predicted protein [Fibroporia radiculosa]